MSGESGFTPASAGGDGGYFAAAPATSAFAPPGYGPSASSLGSGGPTATQPTASGPASVPAMITVACAFLAVTGVAALWTGLTILISINSLPFSASPEAGGYSARGVLLLINGAANLYLPYLLVRGSNPARIVASVACGWWVAYWLYECSRASKALGALASGPFDSLGGLGFMATLGLLLIAAWAALTAGLLWTPTSSAHFRNR